MYANILYSTRKVHQCPRPVSDACVLLLLLLLIADLYVPDVTRTFTLYPSCLWKGEKHPIASSSPYSDCVSGLFPPRRNLYLNRRSRVLETVTLERPGLTGWIGWMGLLRWEMEMSSRSRRTPCSVFWGWGMGRS